MPDWGWWALLAMALLGVEILTLDLLFASFAVGAAAAAIAAALDVPVLGQVAIAAGVAILTVLTLRPLLLRLLHRGDAVVTNVDALVGAGAIVLERVDNRDGRVKVGGEIWSARSGPKDQSFDPGTVLTVVRIDGATAIVDRSEEL